jgi:predicted RNase H-like HicB family nuclease
MSTHAAPHFTARIYREGEWYVAFCPEMPEASGQGRTEDEAVQSLHDAIELLIEDRRADAEKTLPSGGVTRELAFA